MHNAVLIHAEVSCNGRVECSKNLFDLRLRGVVLQHDMSHEGAKPCPLRKPDPAN